MLKQIKQKVIEAITSVLPVALIVLVLYFTPLVSMTSHELVTFIIATLILILGIALFNLGSDLSMTPMGMAIGSGLTKRKKFKLLGLICLVFGILITIAEPDLTVLASQVKEAINSTAFVLVIAAGVGLLLVSAVFRIIFKRKLSPIISFLYLVIFALTGMVAVSGHSQLLPLAFDSGGVTTGPVTVPFIMALGVGISRTLGGRNSEENSFGLVALCSIGPVIAVLLVSLFMDNNLTFAVPSYSLSAELGSAILTTFLHVLAEVAVAMGIIVAFFFIVNFTILKLKKDRIIQIMIGIGYTFAGLVLFLTAANIGYMPIGYLLGEQIANSSETVMVIVGFVLGLVVVLAEPAIHVLNKQVSDVTSGKVSKRSMLIALSIGVGLSIGLSMIRIIYDFSILYYLIPGYIISLYLAFFVPPLYTAIAFDSGGVASGPLTSTFILPFAIGACLVIQGEGNILSDAFGIVAMVAMTPLITIQLLGFKSIASTRLRERRSMRRVLSADDQQIIRFR